MAQKAPRGFTEYRTLHGAYHGSTRWYQVKANGASGSFQKFPGDPVVLVSGNSVARVPSATTAAALPVVGVIRACYTGAKRPLTFNQPSVGGAFIPASTDGWVEVNANPFQTYTVNADSSIKSSHIGAYFDVTANTPSTAAGRSGLTLEVATCAAVASAGGVINCFQVIQIADDNLDGIVATDNNQNVEVRIVWHKFNQNVIDK